MAATDLGKVTIVPKGAYNPSEIYERLDAVHYHGRGYLALRSVQGVAPVDGDDWMLLVGVEALSADKVVVTDSDGVLSVSNVTSEEIEQIGGVTSNIQSQLNDLDETKQGKRDDTFLTDNKTVSGAINEIFNSVGGLSALIPNQATSDNKLADKAFVNSSIGTNTANYISNSGQPFTSVAQLVAYTGTVTNNDYAFVTGTDTAGNTYFDRYKATVSGTTVSWGKEYRLNNSSFTAVQWAAIESGITSAAVAKIDTAVQPSDLLAEATLTLYEVGSTTPVSYKIYAEEE